MRKPKISTADLVNKDVLSGKELGILYVAYFAFIEKSKSPERLFSWDWHKKKLDYIMNTEEGLERAATWSTYNGYTRILDWINIWKRYLQAEYQQFQLRYVLLLNTLDEALKEENIYNYLSKLPVIFTEKQISDFLTTSYPAYSSEGVSVTELATELINFTLSYPNVYGDFVTPLKDKYSNEPCTLDKIANSYNTVNGNGYYVLADGRRSDKLTDKEWKVALNQFDLKSFIDDLIANCDTIYSEGRDSDDPAIWKALYKKNLILKEDVLEQNPELKWYYYDTPPENLTKWDIIVSGLDCYNLTAEELNTEFHDLFALSVEKVAQILNDSEIALRDLNRLDYVLLRESQLFDIDFCHRKQNGTFDVILKHYPQAELNGYAVLNPNPYLGKPINVNESGNYSGPDVAEYMSHGSEMFQSLSNAGSYGLIQYNRELMYASYRFLYSFNTLIDMIQSYYDIPYLENYKTDFSRLDDLIENLNTKTYLLRKKLESSTCPLPLKEKKLAALDKYFYEFDTEVKISQTEIGKVKAEFKKGTFDCFANIDFFRNTFLAGKPIKNER